MAGPNRYTPADRYIFRLPQAVASLAGADLVVARRASDGQLVALPYSNFASGNSIANQLFGTILPPFTWVTSTGVTGEHDVIYCPVNDCFYFAGASNTCVKINCTTGLCTELTFTGTATYGSCAYDSANNRVIILCGNTISAVNIGTDAVTVLGTTATDTQASFMQFSSVTQKVYGASLMGTGYYQWDANGSGEVGYVTGVTSNRFHLGANGQVYLYKTASNLQRMTEAAFGTVQAFNNALPGGDISPMMYCPLNALLYVCKNVASLDVFDGSTLTFVATINLPTGAGGPTNLRYDPNSQKLYVETSTANIYAIDPTTNQITGFFKSASPYGSALGINTNRRQLIDIGATNSAKRWAI